MRDNDNNLSLSQKKTVQFQSISVLFVQKKVYQFSVCEYFKVVTLEQNPSPPVNVFFDVTSTYEISYYCCNLNRFYMSNKYLSIIYFFVVVVVRIVVYMLHNIYPSFKKINNLPSKETTMYIHNIYVGKKKNNLRS